jgi:hypothetical protein
VSPTPIISLSRKAVSFPAVPRSARYANGKTTIKVNHWANDTQLRKAVATLAG